MAGALTATDVAATIGIGTNHVVACDPRDAASAKTVLLTFIESQKAEVCEPAI